MWSLWTWVATASRSWSRSCSTRWRSGRSPSDVSTTRSTSRPRTCHTLQRSSGCTWGSVTSVMPVAGGLDDEPRIGDGQGVEVGHGRAYGRSGGDEPGRHRRRRGHRAGHVAAGGEQRRQEAAPAPSCTPRGRPCTVNVAAPGMRSARSCWRAVGTTPSSSLTTTAVGTSTPPTHARESKRSVSRPASRICVQSWRPTSSKPHHAGSRRPRQPVQLAERDARQAGPAGSSPATALVPVATEVRTRSRDRALERGAGRAQHEPVDQLGVAAPEELGDRATHRVADGDDVRAARARGRGRRRRRRTARGGTGGAERRPRPWPRWSRATTWKCSASGR